MPVLRKLIVVYKIWHASLGALPRLSRFSIGTKIDGLFTETIESALAAGYASRDQKLHVIRNASAKLDALKFFIQLAWEVKAIDHKKYALLAEPLVEIGKMLGGWQKQVEKYAPA